MRRVVSGTVYTDGVLVFSGRIEPGRTVRADSVSVIVTDDVGGTVDGLLRLNSVTPDPEGGGDEVALVWAPSTPMAPATRHDVEWDLSDPTAGTIFHGTDEFSTDDGARPPLDLPRVTSRTLATANLQHGPFSACSASYSTCPHTLRVGEGETAVPSLEVGIDMPVPGPASGWTYALAAIDGAGTLAVAQRPVLHASPGTVLTAAFSDCPARYCVRVVVQDLWSGATLRSNPECVEQGRPRAVVSRRRDLLRDCQEPPGYAQTPAWCELHPENTSYCSSVDAGGAPTAAARASSLCGDYGLGAGDAGEVLDAGLARGPEGGARGGDALADADSIRGRHDAAGGCAYRSRSPGSRLPDRGAAILFGCFAIAALRKRD